MATTQNNRCAKNALSRRAALAAPIATLLAITPFASAQAETSVVTPGNHPVGSQVDNCFWGYPVANVGPIDVLNQSFNSLNWDTNNTYYPNRFTLPAGATLTLHGQFPHSRFFSLTTYKKVGKQSGLPAVALSDEDIVPDVGSINPFLAGADRTSEARSFTITLNGDVPPQKPARNTLYVGQEGHANEAQTVELWLRIYRTDKDLPVDGGVQLPTVTFEPAKGSAISDLPINDLRGVCKALSVKSGGDVIPWSSVPIPVASYLALRNLAPAPHPAQDPPRWYRFTNADWITLAPLLMNTPLDFLAEGLPRQVKPGLYGTPANGYITSYMDRTIGPNKDGHNILVMHAKMPTHPRTYDHERTMDSANTQVRYMSVCTVGSFANIPGGAQLPDLNACIFDEQIPTNAKGYFTYVMSLPEDRPANADTKCGVVWQSWGQDGKYVGDGLGRDSLIQLVIRQQLAAPTFKERMENVTDPLKTKEDIGEYYPVGTYMDKQKFETRGCDNANPL